MRVHRGAPEKAAEGLEHACGTCPAEEHLVAVDPVLPQMPAAEEEHRGRGSRAWRAPQLLPERPEGGHAGARANHHQRHVASGQLEARRAQAHGHDVADLRTGAEPLGARAEAAPLPDRRLATDRERAQCAEHLDGLCEGDGRVAEEGGADVQLTRRRRRRRSDRVGPRALPRAMEQEGAQVQPLHAEGGPELQLRPPEMLVLEDAHGDRVAEQAPHVALRAGLERGQQGRQHPPRGRPAQVAVARQRLPQRARCREGPPPLSLGVRPGAGGEGQVAVQVAVVQFSLGAPEAQQRGDATHVRGAALWEDLQRVACGVLGQRLAATDGELDVHCGGALREARRLPKLLEPQDLGFLRLEEEPGEHVCRLRASLGGQPAQGRGNPQLRVARGDARAALALRTQVAPEGGPEPRLPLLEVGREVAVVVASAPRVEALRAKLGRSLVELAPHAVEVQVRLVPEAEHAEADAGQSIPRRFRVVHPPVELARVVGGLPIAGVRDDEDHDAMGRELLGREGCKVHDRHGESPGPRFLAELLREGLCLARLGAEVDSSFVPIAARASHGSYAEA